MTRRDRDALEVMVLDVVEHRPGIAQHLVHHMEEGVAELQHKTLTTPTRLIDVVNFNPKNTGHMMHFRLLKDLVEEFNSLINLILNRVLEEALFGFNQVH